MKLPRFKRGGVSKDVQTWTGVNEKRSHLLRRGEWADKTGGLALPIAPFLRDKKGWTTRNRGKKRRFKSLVRRRSLKENKQKKELRGRPKKNPPELLALSNLREA